MITYSTVQWSIQALFTILLFIDRSTALDRSTTKLILIGKSYLVIIDCNEHNIDTKILQDLSYFSLLLKFNLMKNESYIFFKKVILSISQIRGLLSSYNMCLPFLFITFSSAEKASDANITIFGNFVLNTTSSSECKDTDILTTFKYMYNITWS